MVFRSAQRLGFAVAALLIGCASASASLLLTPVPTNNTLAVGDVYDTGEVDIAGNTPISTYYEFTVSTNINSQSIETTFHPTGSGGLGIIDATLQWYAFNGSSFVSVGSSGFLQVTDNSGAETSLEPTLNFALTNPPGLYELLVSGTTENSGGNYDLSVTAFSGSNQGQTPLPGALALFGSVIAGSGLFARRRRRAAL